MHYQLTKNIRYYTPTYHGESLRVSGEAWPAADDPDVDEDELPVETKPELPAAKMYFSGTEPGNLVLAVESFQIICGEVDEEGLFIDPESCESSEPSIDEIRNFFWANAPANEELD